MTTDLTAVLSAFRAATQCEAAVWAQASEGKTILEATTGETPSIAELPTVSEGIRSVDSDKGPILVSAVPGPRRAWLALGPCTTRDGDLESYMRFMIPVVGQYLQSALEVEHAANELAERYEEINLLYAISELLGGTTSVENVADTLLHELAIAESVRGPTIESAERCIRRW